MGKVKVATSEMKRSRTTNTSTNTNPNANANTNTNNNNNVNANNKRKKKKKGRPSLLDLQKRSLNNAHPNPNPNTTPANHYFFSSNSKRNFTPNSTPFRRSTRRNPIPDDLSPAPEFEDDDDERKEKKVKLVVRLPQLGRQHFPSNSPSPDSSAADDEENSNSNSNQDASVKKRKFNDRSDPFTPDQVLKVSKATDTLHGSPLESGPTTPLPDKKLLFFILDRLQKKDTYGVFSEPVDPNELPDYHEIIEHPMDFGTVRKKLDEGLYLNLDELEADVLLICSNAMQYNAPDTIYFRQARSIQELAKRDFDNLKQEGEDGEPRPIVVRRGRPPTKNLKKPVARPPVDPVVPVHLDLSSGATLATGTDDATGSNSYNLRRGPMLYRYRSTDALFAPHRSSSGENGTEWVSDWNNEFPASILKADMKYGKKQFSFPLDENKRDTYKQFHPSALGHELSALTIPVGDVKQLMAVGLHAEHGYARSLTRFAANLGPTAWKVASRKINSVLPSEMKFGPGWVGDNEASAHAPCFSSEKCKSSDNLTFDGHPSQPGNALNAGMNSVVHRDPLPCKEEMAEAVGKLNSQSEMAVLRSGVSAVKPWPPYHNQQSQQKPVLQLDRNGVNGMFGYNLSSQMGRVRPATPTQFGQRESSLPSQIIGVASKSDALAAQPTSLNNIGSEESKLSMNSTTTRPGNLLGPEVGFSGRNSQTDPKVGLLGQALPMHNRQFSISGPPDLNVRFQVPGSPSSNLQIGSPQQPDLALQL